MNTTLHWSLVAILYSVIGASALAQLTEGDIRLAHVGQDSTGNPNHLEPIPAFSENGYNEAVFRSLIKGSQPQLWMVAKPSFSPEYALILYHDVKYATDDDPFGDRKPLKDNWVLIYREAAQRIWRFSETTGGQLALDVKPTENVKEHRAIIPEESANVLISAWKDVLLKTRYSGRNYRGTDGEIYQFYCAYDLFGETWSPSDGVPAALVRLGHDLIDMVQSNTAERPALLKKAVTLAQEIQKAEQGGAEQPATAPESKSEDNQEPKPEAEERSQ